MEMDKWYLRIIGKVNIDQALDKYLVTEHANHMYFLFRK